MADEKESTPFDEYWKWLLTWDKQPEGAHSDDGKAIPYAWIQWKGTDACVDFHCTCGSHLHFDTYFLYHVRCLDCNRLYSLASTITVKEIPEAHVPYVESAHPKEGSDPDNTPDEEQPVEKK